MGRSRAAPIREPPRRRSTRNKVDVVIKLEEPDPEPEMILLTPDRTTRRRTRAEGSLETNPGTSSSNESPKNNKRKHCDKQVETEPQAKRQRLCKNITNVKQGKQAKPEKPVKQTKNTKQMKNVKNAKQMKPIREIKQEELPSPINHHVPSDAQSVVSDASCKSNIKEDSIRNLSADDYRQRMLATLRVYKYMSIGGASRPLHLPFLTRNLMFVKAYKHKRPDSFTLGRSEPPPVWPFAAAQKIMPPKSLNAKRARIEDCIGVLKNRTKVESVIEKNHEISYKFRVGSLACYLRSKEVRALYNDSHFRRYMINKGKRCPPRAVNCYRLITDAPPAGSLSTKKGGRNAKKEPEEVVEDVYYRSLVFKSIRHKLVAGDRICRVQIFLVEQFGNTIQRTSRIPSSSFMMPLNDTATIFIDIPDFQPRPELKVHVLLKVDVSENQTDVSIEGRSLRKTQSRAVLSPTSEKTKSSKDRKRNTKWEESYFGSRQIYVTPDGKGKEAKEGYLEGEINVTLVNSTLVPSDINNPNMINLVQTLGKKLHTNPFVQLSLGKFILEEEDPAVIGEEKALKEKTVKKEPSSRATSEDQSMEGEREPLRTAIDCYTGRFKWDSKGGYVNDRKMLEHMFQCDILRDRMIRQNLQSWMPISHSKSILYRILCVTDEEFEKPSAEQKKCFQAPMKRPKEKLTAFPLKWVTAIQTTHTDKCIICNKRMPNLFALMLHYHANYPRLTFTFDMQRPMQEANGVVHIDVCLNPHFVDTMEVKISKETLRRVSRPPLYFITKDQARALRRQMRMDQTIFCHILRAPEIVDEETVRKSRFISVDCGKQLGVCETGSNDPRRMPQPSWEPLVQFMTERMLDFIDIDEKTKRYMATWNKLTIAIGRGNMNAAGCYMLHRLFLTLFRPYMKEAQQINRFFMQLCDMVDRGMLSGDEHYDLMRRVRNPHYSPLDDPLCSINGKLLDFAAKQHKKFNNALSAKNAPPGVRRTFHRLFRKNPMTMSRKENELLIEYLLMETEALPKIDPRRSFMTGPYSVIFDGIRPAVLKNITPVV